jgi:magnesium transporter
MSLPSQQTLTALIESAVQEQDFAYLKKALGSAHPEDIAETLNQLPLEQAQQVLTHVQGRKYFDVFGHIDLNTQVQLIQGFQRKHTLKILEELSADDRVDLLEELPEHTQAALLPLMAQTEREQTKRLLEYGDDTAGAIMTTEYATLPMSYTASEALQHLPRIAPNSETIYYLYVVDKENKLEGILSLKKLVLAFPYQRVEELMNRDFVSAYVDEDQEAVANQLGKYDLLAIPIVDRKRRIVGIVTYDDAMDVVVEEQTEDIHRLGALEPVETPYLKTNFWKLAQNRGLWLMVLFFGVSFTGAALKHYHETFEAALALVYFVPLIVSSGGNTGSQSVTLITRALAVGDLDSRKLKQVMIRELMMGIVLGLFLGTVGVACASLLGTAPAVTFSVGIALLGVVVAGSLIGGILPILLDKMGLDPAIMSSPLVASIVDVIGVVIYFKVAQMLIPLW